MALTERDHRFRWVTLIKRNTVLEDYWISWTYCGSAGVSLLHLQGSDLHHCRKAHCYRSLPAGQQTDLCWGKAKSPKKHVLEEVWCHFSPKSFILDTLCFTSSFSESPILLWISPLRPTNCPTILLLSSTNIINLHIQNIRCSLNFISF